MKKNKKTKKENRKIWGNVAIAKIADIPQDALVSPKTFSFFESSM